MDSNLRSHSFARRLAQMSREVLRARSACHAAIKRIHNESHLSALHRLLDVHAALLGELDSVDTQHGNSVVNAVASRISGTRVALNALASPTQTLVAVLEQQQKLQHFIEEQISHAHLPLNMVLTIDEHLGELVAGMRDLANCIDLQSDRLLMTLRRKNLKEVINGRAWPRVPAAAPQPHRSTDY